MTEPLTIYECPEHGVVSPEYLLCPQPMCGAYLDPVRVFREEEVRERVLIWQVWVGELQQQLRAHGLLQLQAADPNRPMPDVFLGEDVRPLWELAVRFAPHGWDEDWRGFLAFPAPEEWKHVGT